MENTRVMSRINGVSYEESDCFKAFVTSNKLRN